jgi:hypothetical protein
VISGLGGRARLGVGRAIGARAGGRYGVSADPRPCLEAPRKGR